MVILELLCEYRCNKISINNVSIQKMHKDRCVRSRERGHVLVCDNICDFDVVITYKYTRPIE